MVNRTFWIKALQKAWKRRSVLWLCGVRRSGKTMLCRSIPGIGYFDCELPRIRRILEDPESFLENCKHNRVAFDEIHRLNNASELLKIAADYFPKIKIIATGSSTLEASAKFKDTLAGRKETIFITPMTTSDLDDFGNIDLARRLYKGGLPPFLLSKKLPEHYYQEWVDAYWAKDVQELFRLEQRHAFQKFFEMLMTQSGGLFEATRFAGPCEVSRGTISNYLKALEETFVVHVVRPFSSYKPSEIIAAPKTYAFDSGFVAYYRGWRDERPEDMGILWEHFVLNELIARLQTRKIFYWRDKSGHEVDFIFVKKGEGPIAIECKWRASEFTPQNLCVFRKHYPKGENLVVAQDVKAPYKKKYACGPVTFMPLADLAGRLA